MKYIALLICLLIGAAEARAQSYRSDVNGGNEAYREKNFDDAGKRYSDAVSNDPLRVEGYFNLGNTAYRKDDAVKAIEEYKRAGERARSKHEGAQLWFNGGNALMKMNQYEQAVEAYKQSLKLNPDDEDARYNLLYAMKKLADEKNKEKNKDQKKDDKKDQKKDDKKDQDKQDQDKKDQEKKDQQQNQDQQKQDQQPKDEQQQPQKPKDKQMSKQQAEQILKALERDEKELQKKNREKRAVRVQVDKDW